MLLFIHWSDCKSLKIRYREHIRYIKTDNPNSIYALHILNNRHACVRKHGIARHMYKGAENELLGITFYTNSSTTGYIDRRTGSSMTSTLFTRWRTSQGCTETISQKWLSSQLISQQAFTSETS